jgi:hypothetical protein
MDWAAVSGISAAVVVIMAIHAGLMKFIIDGAITKVLLKISERYATKEELLRHLDQEH